MPLPTGLRNKSPHMIGRDRSLPAVPRFRFLRTPGGLQRSRASKQMETVDDKKCETSCWVQRSGASSLVDPKYSVLRTTLGKIFVVRENMRLDEIPDTTYQKDKHRAFSPSFLSPVYEYLT